MMSVAFFFWLWWGGGGGGNGNLTWFNPFKRLYLFEEMHMGFAAGSEEQVTWTRMKCDLSTWVVLRLPLLMSFEIPPIFRGRSTAY